MDTDRAGDPTKFSAACACVPHKVTRSEHFAGGFPATYLRGFEAGPPLPSTVPWPSPLAPAGAPNPAGPGDPHCRRRRPSTARPRARPPPWAAGARSPPSARRPRAAPPGPVPRAALGSVPPGAPSPARLLRGRRLPSPPGPAPLPGGYSLKPLRISLARSSLADMMRRPPPATLPRWPAEPLGWCPGAEGRAAARSGDLRLAARAARAGPASPSPELPLLIPSASL